MSNKYTIGQLAKAGNCKVQTIRYYEEIGIIPEPARTAGNQRIYSQSQFDRLNFIRHSRELGFSLEQIRQILQMNDSPNQSCEEVNQIAELHLKDVESKISRLMKMRDELQRMVSQCSGNHISNCRIIGVLSDHGLCNNHEH